MNAILQSPGRSLAAGFGLALLLALFWLFSAGADGFSALAFALRWAHVLAGIVWVGLVFFVNFVQLVAMYEVDDEQRAFIGKVIGARVAWWFRQASHLSVVTGLGLLLSSGYLLPSLVFGSAVFAPGTRVAVLWTGVAGALLMWAFVHMLIWPNLQIMSGARPGDADARGRARIKVRNFARLNLVLSVPVIFAMVAASHL